MTSIIINKFYPIVEKGLRNNRKSKDIQNYIVQYMDKNSEILLDSGLNYRLIFNEKDKYFIPVTLDLDVKQIKNELESAGLTNDAFIKWNNNPWIWSLVLSIRYYMLNKKEKEMDMIIMYYSLGIYSSLHAKYFPKFLPNENIMDYTINSLSNKYYIKKYGNLIKALMATSKNSHDSYNDKLAKGTDEDLMYYASQLESRLNALVKGIANQYEKNRKEKNYFNKENESFDEEDYYEIDNVSFQLGRLADKISLSLTSNRLRRPQIQLSARINGIDYEFLEEALGEIMKNEVNNINKLITTILQVYLVDEKHGINTVGSSTFIMESMKIINRSNTSNKRVIWLKDIIDSWLNKYTKMFRENPKNTNRVKYRKAVYQYFILSIQAIVTNK